MAFLKACNIYTYWAEHIMLFQVFSLGVLRHVCTRSEAQHNPPFLFLAIETEPWWRTCQKKRAYFRRFRLKVNPEYWLPVLQFVLDTAEFEARSFRDGQSVGRAVGPEKWRSLGKVRHADQATKWEAPCHTIKCHGVRRICRMFVTCLFEKSLRTMLNDYGLESKRKHFRSYKEEIDE